MRRLKRADRRRGSAARARLVLACDATLPALLLMWERWGGTRPTAIIIAAGLVTAIRALASIPTRNRRR